MPRSVSRISRIHDIFTAPQNVSRLVPLATIFPIVIGQTTGFVHRHIGVFDLLKTLGDIALTITNQLSTASDQRHIVFRPHRNFNSINTGDS